MKGMAGCALPTIPRPSKGRAPALNAGLANREPFAHPRIHLRQQPRDAIGAKPDPPGELPAASSRAMCWGVYGMPQTVLNSFFDTSRLSY